MTCEIDITGKQFGRLTAVKKVKSVVSGKQKRSVWLFCCSCGKEKEIIKSPVVRGKIVSCGCQNHENIMKRNTKHGQSETILYSKWLDMKHRVLLPKTNCYKNYGGRGIKVCKEWIDAKNGFSNFMKWAVGNGYNPSLSLDRIDVNGDYTPRNCRWITMREQQLNKRTNRKITICGKTKCLCEWLKTYKIHRNTFYYRLKKGYSELEAITGEKGI